MGDQYDRSKPSKYISHLDTNNLYGWAMSQPLPIGDFKWLTEEELDEMTNDHAKIKGCTLEVDLEYPDDLHDLHNDYPFAPEFVTVNGVEKLVPNLNNKTKYVVSYLFLQECIKHVPTKIHQGMKFSESTFLKKYIDTNTASRTKSSVCQNGKDDSVSEQAKILGTNHIGRVKGSHVRVSLRLHKTEVWRESKVVVYQHRLVML